MSISRQNLTVIIVSFKSDNVIHDCIRSINEEISIIVVDNSNNITFKKQLEEKYKNVTSVLSPKNIGMGPGNNLGLNHIKTDFAFILNPDVILYKNTIDEIIEVSKNISEFAIFSPISDKVEYPNYKFFDKEINISKDNECLRVKSVDGFAMLVNMKRLHKVNFLKDNKLFDENFFMYLENDDLCKRLNDKSERIFIVLNSKINHLGAKGVDEKYKSEIELSRNWHWLWSKFYFNKKHYGFVKAFLVVFPNFLTAILRFIFYCLLMKKNKRKIYFNRINGFLNALIGKKSSYRPKID